MHDPSTLEKLRIILTLRHHNVRALLHRPILTMFLELAGKFEVNQQEIILLQQIGSNSVKICAESTMEIVAIVSTIVKSTGERRNWLGAWWFSLYYTFNAALTIFASLLVIHNTDGVAPTISLTPQALKASFEDAVQALKLLDTGNRMVERCARYLGQLAEVLVSLSKSMLLDLIAMSLTNVSQHPKKMDLLCLCLMGVVTLFPTTSSFPCQPYHFNIPASMAIAGFGCRVPVATQ